MTLLPVMLAAQEPDAEALSTSGPQRTTTRRSPEVVEFRIERAAATVLFTAPLDAETLKLIDRRPGRTMIFPGARSRVWIAAGVTDMRKGMAGLSAMVQTQLDEQPFSGDVFAFRGRRGDLVKLLWWSGDGMNLYVNQLSSYCTSCR